MSLIKGFSPVRLFERLITKEPRTGTIVSDMTNDPKRAKQTASVPLPN